MLIFKKYFLGLLKNKKNTHTSFSYVVLMSVLCRSYVVFMSFLSFYVVFMSFLYNIFFIIFIYHISSYNYQYLFIICVKKELNKK